MISSCSTVCGALLWAEWERWGKCRDLCVSPVWGCYQRHTSAFLSVWSSHPQAQRLRCLLIYSGEAPRLQDRVALLPSVPAWGMELSLGVYFLPFINLMFMSLSTGPGRKVSLRYLRVSLDIFARKCKELFRWHLYYPKDFTYLKMQFSLIIPSFSIKVGLRITFVKSRVIRKL